MKDKKETGLNGQCSDQQLNDLKEANKTTDVRASVLLLDHRDSLVSLDAQENLPLSQIEGPSDTVKFHLYATEESALAESQARIQNLLPSKDSSSR